MSKLEISLDSTALGHCGCITDLWNTVVGTVEEGKVMGGFKPHMPNSALIYGVAVHKFIDTMFKTGEFQTAKREANKVFMVDKKSNSKKTYLDNPRHMEMTCYGVWTERVESDDEFKVIEVEQDCWWCKGNGFIEDKPNCHAQCQKCNGTGKRIAPATELTFKIKYYEDDYIIVWLCGTIDTLGLRHNLFCIRDWKTTGAWDERGYLNSYAMSRQLRIYNLAPKLVHAISPESTIGKLGAGKIGSFIDAIFLHSRAQDNQFGRSKIFMFEQWEIDELRKQLDKQCKKLSDVVRTGEMEREGIITGGCEKRFGLCEYFSICQHQGPVRQAILKRDFKQAVYDPLNFRD